MKARNNIFQEYTCDHCGTEFIITNQDMWVYKATRHGRLHYFCRYNCMQAFRAGQPPRKHSLTGTQGKLNPEIKDAIIAGICDGKSNVEIADALRVSCQRVHYYRTRLGMRGENNAGQAADAGRDRSEIRQECEDGYPVYAADGAPGEAAAGY